MLTFLRLPLRQVLFGLVVILIALLDPFGLATSTDDASANWLNRLLATQYADDGQRQVVVVMIDDAYLQRNQTYWPLPYGEQSKVFKRLLAYQPAAVFVDLLYSHDHSRTLPGQAPRLESQLLANVFARYQQQGIPLFLANTGLPRGEQGTVNALQRFTEVSTPALVTWSGHGDQYPLAEQTRLGLMETPALKLYREYCRRTACPALPVDASAASQLPDMAVQWGLYRSLEQAKVAKVGDCNLPTLSQQLLQAVFWKLGSNAQSNCVYSLTLSASDLETTDADEQALLKRLLHGKLVLVGASITGTGDITVSPLHGKIAGVYSHAMALDNLINWGMDYYRDTPSLADYGFTRAGGVDVLDLAELALLALIAYLRGSLDAPILTRSLMHQQRRPLLRSLAAWALVLLLLLGLSAVLWLKNFTPANVLGLLLISLTLFSARIQARSASSTW